MDIIVHGATNAPQLKLGDLLLIKQKDRIGGDTISIVTGYNKMGKWSYFLTRLDGNEFVKVRKHANDRGYQNFVTSNLGTMYTSLEQSWSVTDITHYPADRIDLMILPKKKNNLAEW